MLLLLIFSITYILKLFFLHFKITYVSKQPLRCVIKISCYYVLHLQRKLLNNFSKILKKNLQLLTGLRFDIYYVIKVRVDLKLQKIQDFKLSQQLFICSLKQLLMWKCLKVLRSTSIVKLFVYKTVKCEFINIEFLSRGLPLNNAAIMAK